VRKLGVADSVTRTLLVLKTSSLEILMRHADVSVKLKDFTGALADYDRLVQQYPRNAEVVYHRGLAYMESGRCDSAIADLGASLTLDPKNWRAYVARALCLRKSGLAEKGRADLMAAKALEPANTVIDDVIKTYPAR
jgi:Flp pilus assembly protein TadD